MKCPLCGSHDATHLGNLCRRMQLRCRDCSYVYSVTLTHWPEPEEEGEPDD